MKIAIRYFSRGGNTKKLAEALAQAVGVEALSIEEDLEEDIDILFLGCSVYVLGIDKAIINFIQNIKVNIGRIVNFGSSAFEKKEGGIYEMNRMMKYKFSGGPFFQIRTVLEKKGLQISEDYFHCLAQFGQINKGKPDQNDLASIQTFAKQFLVKE